MLSAFQSLFFFQIGLYLSTSRSLWAFFLLFHFFIFTLSGGLFIRILNKKPDREEKKRGGGGNE